MAASRILIRIALFFWLIAKVISYKVWLTARIFPVVPVFDLLAGTPAYVHVFLYSFSLFCLLVLTIKPDFRIVATALLVSEILSASLDYMRWQPWEYEYLFILLIYILNKKDEKFMSVIAFMLIALYAYSGIHKLNHGFLVQIWDNMMLRSLGHFHISHQGSKLFYLGYLLGITELTAAIGLIFKNTRIYAAIVLIIMHLFNLYWLGPLGMNYNVVVWPWNIAMICFLYLVFIGQKEILLTDAFKGLNILVPFFWGLMPAFNFFNCWDHYLSGSLYSGKLTLMGICVDTRAAPELAQFVSPNDVYHMCEGKSLVKLQSWSLKELNVPPYPEYRVYQKINKTLKTKYAAINCFTYHFGSNKNIHDLN